MKNTLINYGKHVDFHNNGRKVYKDLHKTGNKQLKIGQKVLDRIEWIMPIDNFDRKKSYPNELKSSDYVEYAEHADAGFLLNLD